jgi:hypothetical protein
VTSTKLLCPSNLLSSFTISPVQHSWFQIHLIEILAYRMALNLISSFLCIPSPRPSPAQSYVAFSIMSEPCLTYLSLFSSTSL